MALAPFISTIVTVTITALDMATEPLRFIVDGKYPSAVAYQNALGLAGLGALGGQMFERLATPWLRGRSIRIAVRFEAAFVGGSHTTTWSTIVHPSDQESDVVADWLARQFEQEATHAWSAASTPAATRAALISEGLMDPLGEEPPSLADRVKIHSETTRGEAKATVEVVDLRIGRRCAVQHMGTVEIAGGEIGKSLAVARASARTCPFCAGHGCPLCAYEVDQSLICQCALCRAARGGVG